MHVSLREHFYPNCYIPHQALTLQVCSDALIPRGCDLAFSQHRTSEAELSKQEWDGLLNFTSSGGDSSQCLPPGTVC